MHKIIKIYPTLSTHKGILFFDFDGTLVDSHEHMEMLIGMLARKYGFPGTAKENLAELRKEGFKAMAHRLKIGPIKLFRMMYDSKKWMGNLSHEIQMISGIREQLTTLQEMGFAICILTTNSKKNVLGILEKLTATKFFSWIICDASLKDKSIPLKPLVQRFGGSVFTLVGDESRDLEAAEKLGIKSVGVCWGLQDKTNLARNKPNLLLEKPSQLALEIAGLYGSD